MEKGFTITYEYGDNLYVNPTNRCNFNCAFCLRHNQGSGGSIYTHNLWLKREPTKEEILSSIESHDLSQYKQLVFVGFGEPTYRFDDICWVIDQMKAHGTKIFTRMDTNGTGSLINGRDIAPEFAGRFDMVSVSLNTDTAEKYNALCHPQQENAYQAMKDFTREVLKYVPTVMMTVVDTIPKEEIENCRKICEEEIGRHLPGAGVHCGLTNADMKRRPQGRLFFLSLCMEYHGLHDDADAAQEEEDDGALLELFLFQPGPQPRRQAHGQHRRGNRRQGEQQHRAGEQVGD